ncbi:MAG TPA: hypothetical protein VFT13_11135 [Candidatus Krumholzibacteria bacterium]|nr:hypothetical protein [Candidatus Krumholzibacteria bacterium]
MCIRSFLSSSLVGLVLPLVTAVGCEHDPASSSSDAAVPATLERAGAGGVAGVPGARGGGLVPLGSGYRWTYQGGVVFQEPGEPFQIPRVETHTIIGTESRSGRDYWLLEQVIEEHVFGGDREIVNWSRLRQDRTGLFVADVSVIEPPAGLSVAAEPCADALAEAAWERMAGSLRDSERAAYRRAWEELAARRDALRSLVRLAASTVAATGLGRDPGGVAAGELTRLSYPLHPGAEWVIREEPLFRCRVEAVDVLALPIGRVPAYRTRIEGVFFDADDDVFFWYGHVGFVGQSVHTETVATDPDGNPIGTLIADDTLFLTSVTLGTPGGLH